MSNTTSNDLLEQLWTGANTGRFAAPDQSLEVSEGQSLQVELLRRWQDTGETPGGWKLGLTSGKSRDRFGPGIRPFGFILASRILNSGDQLDMTRVGRGGIENELCFTMAKSLNGDATRADAIDAVANVSPAFEINQLRIDGKASPGLSVADDLSNWGLVVGPPVALGQNFERMTVRLLHDGGVVDEVAASGHADDHFESIARLARELNTQGLALRSGDRVITGAFTRTKLATGLFTGDFGLQIGQVKLEITE